MSRGRFITIEGGEGAGKSTCLAGIKEALGRRGITPLITREPGGTPIAERIRDLLLDPLTPEMDPQTELLLVFAARYEHVHHHVMPALKRGQWVVSDRFVDASYAYQGAGRGVDPGRIDALAQWALDGLEPDLTILLDVPAEIGLRRATAQRAPDRLERERLDFYQRVREAYLQRAKAQPSRFAVVDATRSRAAVRQDVIDQLSQFLEVHEN